MKPAENTPERVEESASKSGQLTLKSRAGDLTARRSGALWRGSDRLLMIADLHFGKAARLARQGGVLLPPYEIEETMARLQAEIEALNPAHIACLGDSFDDLRASGEMPEAAWARLTALAQGRRWSWISGNHDPRAATPFGAHMTALALDGLSLRHEAEPTPPAELVEISGHYHPKASIERLGRRMSRRCFLWDGARMILPAFGAFTGGLNAADEAFDALLKPNAMALLCAESGLRAAPRSALAR